MSRSIRFVSVLCFVILGCGKQTSDEAIWGNLRNLGPNINSPGKDEHVTFTHNSGVEG